MPTVLYNVQQFHNKFRNMVAARNQLPKPFTFKYLPTNLQLANSQSNETVTNTSKSQVNAAKLANLNIINTGNKVMRYNI